ncbi:hypothetical protein C3L33_12081, partial [Rhododendron williamsianum]
MRKTPVPPLQVREIAQALEQSRHRFLWSLRQPLPKGKFAIPANEIENGIRKLMENEDKSNEGIKQKVKEMSKKSKTAVEEEGSSYNYIGRFIELKLRYQHQVKVTLSANWMQLCEGCPETILAYGYTGSYCFKRLRDVTDIDRNED